MFVLSFKIGSNDRMRDCFEKYHIPLVKTKNFNALIDNKPYFDQLVKNKQEAYGKHIELSLNDDYVTGNLLDFSYHQNYYKIIGIGLSRKASTSIPQQINFTGKLEENDSATIFFIAEKQQKQFFCRFINCHRII